MKKIITKFMAVFLFCTCFLFMGLTQKANAAMDYSYDWGFGILSAIDGTTGAELEAASVGSNDYILNGNSVIVVNAYVSDAYPGYCYVRVDGNYVGNSTDAGLDYEDENDGNVHYNAFIIKNLTPGNHTIEARADRPWNLGFNYGPMQKIDTINVTVPQATTLVTSISLNNTSLSVVKGLSSTLAATVAPTNATNKAVTWKSSNTAVATVDASGKVTGVAAGTATITCTASDGSGKSATCAVTVTNPTLVTSITLSNSSLSILKGLSSTLAATVAPTNATNKAVTWKSSNTAVATVDATGKVTGVAAGTATITCTASDGSGKYSTCTVTVTNPISVTSISLDHTSLNLGVVETPPTLTATVSPSNATNKAVTWKSSNTAVATVDSTGKVTGVATGSATITCTANDGSGKLATCNVTVDSMELQTYLHIVKGDKSQLKALLPTGNANNNIVTWKSSNTAVATVDNNGNITGVGVGNAIITCTVTNGSGQIQTKTICNVNVKNTSIQLDSQTLFFSKGDEPIQQTITATVSPIKTVTWKSSNTAVAKVDNNGNVTIVGTGSATITCAANDGSASATCDIQVI